MHVSTVNDIILMEFHCYVTKNNVEISLNEPTNSLCHISECHVRYRNSVTSVTTNTDNLDTFVVNLPLRENVCFEGILLFIFLHYIRWQ